MCSFGCSASVPNVKNGPPGRKSASTQVVKLPSQTPKRGHRDGSLQAHRYKNFRPKRRKQATGTEACKYIDSKTSVPNAEKGPPGRKSARVEIVKLPSQMPKKASRTEVTEICNELTLNIKHQDLHDFAFPDVLSISLIILD